VYKPVNYISTLAILKIICQNIFLYLEIWVDKKRRREFNNDAIHSDEASSACELDLGMNDRVWGLGRSWNEPACCRTLEKASTSPQREKLENET